MLDDVSNFPFSFAATLYTHCAGTSEKSDLPLIVLRAGAVKGTFSELEAE